MEFHRKKWIRWGIGLGCIVVGLIGALEIYIQWEHYVSPNLRLGRWMYLLPLLIPVGIFVLVFGVGSFRLRIDEYGVTVRNNLESMRMAVPWERIAAMTVERKPGDNEYAAPYLVLWPVPGTNLDAKESYVLNGRPAYALVQVDEIRESVDQLSAALRQYAGPRFLQPQEPPPQPPPLGPPQPPPQYPGPQFPPPQYPGPQYPGPQFPPPGQR